MANPSPDPPKKLRPDETDASPQESAPKRRRSDEGAAAVPTRRPAIQSLATTGLFILALFYTLYFCRSFLLPLVLALLFALLLHPAVRGLKRLRVPEPLGAGLVLLCLLGSLAVGLFQLAEPAYDWVQKAPQSLRLVQSKAQAILKPVETLGRATEQMQKIAEASGGGGARLRAVTLKPASLGGWLFTEAADLAVGAVLMVVLLYFLLASGDLFLRKLVRALPRVEDKRRAQQIARQVRTDMSGYLATVTMINLGLGLAVWLSMSLIGLPNPLLWGVLAAVTNYVPYLGPGVNYVVLTLLGLLTFKDLQHALLPPAVFLMINLVEAYLLTPMILSHRLTLNPVVVFLSLTFWGWMWGVAGAILAVPIMVVFKILCDHIEPLAPLSEFLEK
ncbi:MAG TPA: AI-2E family transporter [Thermoanaerobaculia bacterium]|nr:AI-2E family transporter [Thermoanaerobaculia bacterium]